MGQHGAERLTDQGAAGDDDLLGLRSSAARAPRRRKPGVHSEGRSGLGSETMTSTEMIDLVRRWFVKAEQASGPILPDGWFGRPYDNIFVLKDVQLAGDVLTVYLSEDTTLVFDRLGRVYLDNSELVFEGFRACALRWREYGGSRYEERTYDAGQVRLVPPFGTTVTL